MNPNRGWNCGGRVLQRTSLPLHNHSFGINWSLAAGMTGRHPRLSAMLSHVMAALPLGFTLRETEQQTRHRRRPCPQQDGTQHNGSSYAVHFHESISLSIARQHIDYPLVGGCDVTSVTISYPPGSLKKPSCRKPRRYTSSGTLTRPGMNQQSFLIGFAPMPALPPHAKPK